MTMKNTYGTNMKHIFIHGWISTTFCFFGFSISPTPPKSSSENPRAPQKWFARKTILSFCVQVPLSVAKCLELKLQGCTVYEKEKTATFNKGRPAGLFIKIVLPNATSSLCEYAKARSFSNGFLHRVYCPVGTLPKTNSKFAPKKNWAPKGNSSSNHWFSGANC